MAKIKIPQLSIKSRIEENEITQLLAEPYEGEAQVVRQEKNYIVVNILGETICFTGKKDSYLEGCPHVLLVDKVRPDIAGIVDGRIRCKSWLKHPLIEKVPKAENVINSWSEGVKLIEESESQKGFRTPQIGAIYSILSHLRIYNDLGTVVLPTGTGKTDTMISIMVLEKCGKLLVIVPSDALRSQVAKNFKNLGFLKKFELVHKHALYPRVGIWKKSFVRNESLKKFLDDSNVVIATMNVINNASDAQKTLLSEAISHLFIDEAHHVSAQTWINFRNLFTQSSILQFTATPFRNDGKTLGGKIIFNFPLKKAQEMGYFKKINFYPILNYLPAEADEEIAKKGIEILRNDLEQGYDHILMARCATKKRAQEIYQYYVKERDLNPVVIYSGVKNKNIIIENIVKKKHRIIIAVDMLGEGFDLPELKVAVFHDIRKSLPITLQFAGRFTRTKKDETLGEASFVANIANQDVVKELEELYAQDSDWNAILSRMSEGEILNEVELFELIEGFADADLSKISVQNIHPALSTVVYKGSKKQWSPEFIKNWKRYQSSDHHFYDVNSKDKVLLVVMGQKRKVDWGNFKDIHDLDWTLLLVFWDEEKDLFFIHGSDKAGTYQELAEGISLAGAKIVNEIEVFKAFHNIKRVMLQSVGLKEFLSRQIRFRMSAGSDVGNALSIAEQRKGQKAFVFGAGYEDGNKITLGCSYRGRIWSKTKGSILDFINWCKHIGSKLLDASINPNIVLKDTLIPELITTRPNISPIWVDWNEVLYRYSEQNVQILVDSRRVDLGSCELLVTSPSQEGDILFALMVDEKLYQFSLRVFEDKANENAPSYKIINNSGSKIEISYGAHSEDLDTFFNRYPPDICFADGSILSGNSFVQLKHTIGEYDKNKLIVKDWSNVDLSKESQGVSPKNVSSIQYKMIQDLMQEDIDIIYDDDGSGEIADIVTIKQLADKLSVSFYHLKFAKDGKVSNSIDNLYAVCGQTQKSTKWKHTGGNRFFSHLIHRERKKRDGKECSRIEKGSLQDLHNLKTIAKQKIPVEFTIFLVQPSISKETVTSDILMLLGVTENYLLETGGIKLNIITSA